MTHAMIQTDSLTRMYGTNEVLREVSLSITEGTVCSLLGTNGAGKTTLLKLLMGLIEPTRGLSGIAGDFQMPRSQRTLQRTGCLIDGFEPPGMTRIRHLISLSRDVSPEFDLDRARRLLAEKRLSPNTFWKSLSKGQKRWTLLVMLLCRKCGVLLLDEPADGLDPEARLELYQLIRREANDCGVTTLITTHIINDIEKITDNVCILHNSQIVVHADLEDLREQVVVVEAEAEIKIPPDVEVLRSEVTDRATYWLRDLRQKLPANLPREIRRRNAGLQEIYLAFTKPSTSIIASGSAASTESLAS